MPLPAWSAAGKVVHDRWSTSNRPTAESVLQDRCTVTRPGTGGALDSDTGAVTDTSTTLTTDEPCRVSYAGASIESRYAADERIAVADHVVQFAADFCTVLAPGDEITITCVGPNADPSILGRTYRVAKDGAATFAWTRVVRVEHITHG